MAVVVFNYANWIARYPEFTTLYNSVDPTVVAPECFVEAQAYCNNTNGSPVSDIPTRTLFLNMLTAHIVALNFGVNGQAPSQLVGRVSNAHEGSVGVTADMGKVSDFAAWFMQTKYGAAFWQASAQYRMMRYMPPFRNAYDFIPRS
jgi:hypothetical protein